MQAGIQTEKELERKRSNEIMTKQIRLKDGKVLKVERCGECLVKPAIIPGFCQLINKPVYAGHSIRDDCPLEEWQDPATIKESLKVEPAAPKEQGTTPDSEGCLDKAAVLKAIRIGIGASPPYTLANFFERLERGEFDAKFPPLFSERNVSFVRLCEDHKRALAEKDAEIGQQNAQIKDMKTVIDHQKNEIIVLNFTIDDVRCSAGYANTQLLRAEKEAAEKEIDRLNQKCCELAAEPHYPDGPWDRLHKASEEAAKQKYECELIIEKRDAEIIGLKKTIKSCEMTISDYQSRLAQQDQMLKDLIGKIKALDGWKRTNATYGSPGWSATTSAFNEGISRAIEVMRENVHVPTPPESEKVITAFEPPKDEPELVICNCAEERCKMSCNAWKPHKKSKACTAAPCNFHPHSKCIPYKEEELTVTQEPDPVPKTDISHLRDRIFECEQHQGRDRADLIAEIRELGSSTGTLEGRIDTLETTFGNIWLRLDKLEKGRPT